MYEIWKPHSETGVLVYRGKYPTEREARDVAAANGWTDAKVIPSTDVPEDWREEVEE